MANAVTLTRADGSAYTADVGESSQINGQFYDAQDPGEPIQAAAISSALFGIEDQSTGEEIRPPNSLLLNGGEINPDGTFLIKLSPPDNRMINESKAVETHVGTLTWEWNDGSPTPQKGIQQWLINVASSATGSQGNGGGWIGG